MTIETRDELRLVEPTHQHLASVARRLRKIDRQELAAVSAQDPYADILYSASVSDPCWVLTRNDVPIAVGGVAQHFDADELGVPWFLATDDISDSRVRFWLASKSKEFIGLLHERFRKLENFISAENSITIKWLTHLGFEIGEPKPIGRNGEMLCRIYKEQPECALSR